MQPPPPPKTKRFYKEASVEERPEGWVLLLDGRPARTPARNPLALPTRALGEAVAAEWTAQTETIEPGSMPLTKLANTAIDGVAREMEAVRAELARYAGSDLVLYRADGPEGLVEAQAKAWDPVLGWARAAHDARFVLSEGITHVTQPDTSLARIRAALDAETSPFRLAALHVLTTLSGSSLLALMLAAGALGADEAWHAAHVDEHHQESLWGLDQEAAERRARREAEFRAAARMLSLAKR